jgi:hypothetical protein
MAEQDTTSGAKRTASLTALRIGLQAHLTTHPDWSAKPTAAATSRLARNALIADRKKLESDLLPGV